MLLPMEWLAWLKQTDGPGTDLESTDPFHQKDIIRMDLRALGDLPLQRPQATAARQENACRAD